MSNILVVGEHQGGKIKKVTQELVCKASELAGSLGGEVAVALVGSAPSSPEALGVYGAKKVYCIASGENYSPEGYAAVLKALVDEVKPSAILGTASPMGKDLFPRLALRLKAGLATDCTDLKAAGGKLVATRPLFAGKAFADVTFESPIQMATARPNSFVTKEVAAGAAAEVVTKTIDPGAARAVVKEIVKGKGDRPDLTESSIIVSGGRAMKNSENFHILQELADVLGASVGASRAAVDSGYAPHDMQVGQTGKTVNPNLYIACGISGAIQHLAGMRTSKVIVAINTDAEAPIFQKADYGVVADLFEFIPLLTQEFKTALAE